MYTASQRGRNHPSFVQGSPAKHIPITRSHLGKRRQRQHQRGPFSSIPPTARFRVALREGPPCHFKLVPLHIWNALWGHPRSSITPPGCSEEGLQVSGSVSTLHGPASGSSNPPTRHTSPTAPTFFVSFLADHPRIFTDYSMAPATLPPSLACSRGSPRSPCRAWGSCR